MYTPQIEPITGLSRDYRSILAKLVKGPVFLAQRSRPAAVLLSVQDYERMVERLQQLEGLARAKSILARIDGGEVSTTPHDQLMQEILEKRAGHVGA